MGLLGRAFSAIRLFEDTVVIASETTLAGRTMFGADTFHF